MSDTDNKRIKKIKELLFNKSYEHHISHLPSNLSCLEILYVLYHKIAHITNDNKADVVRDRIIVSKEHARWVQLVILAEAGLIDMACLDRFKADGSDVGQDMYNWVGSKDIAAIDYGSSSLGHGLSVGAGLAYGDPQHETYVIVGDGELQEGSCWEALMFAGQHKLKNLTVIIDRNRLQIDDYTKNIINTSSFSPEAIEKLGFCIIECDGHNVDELEKALQTKSNLPRCIVANTVKGKELEFILKTRDFAPFHWMTLTEEEFKTLKQGD